MKHNQLTALRLIVLGIAAFAAISAMAAPPTGIYYALPSWDQTFPASARFVVLANMNNEAVLDRETGLVWEKSPSTFTANWETAQGQCNQRATGNRRGWRLPTEQELMSLVDPSVAYPGPALPSGNPFTGVQSSHYWSATSSASDPSQAWVAEFELGYVAVEDKSLSYYFWCVRGGQGVDAQ